MGPLFAALLSGCFPAPSKPDDGDNDGFSELDGDCDDADGAIFPGKEDLCGGGDEDCDDEIDEDALAEAAYPDTDGDGFGASGSAALPACDPAPSADNADDCDDRDPAAHPGGAEVCGDGIDQNCDGQADQDATVPLYADGDQDHYGAEPVQGCAGAAGTSAVDGDCDDDDYTVHPDATEICSDGTDQNCAVDCRQSGDITLSAGISSDTGDFGTEAFPLPGRLYGFGVSDRGAGCDGENVWLFEGPVVGDLPFSSVILHYPLGLTGGGICGAASANGALLVAEDDRSADEDVESQDRLILMPIDGFPADPAILTSGQRHLAFGLTVQNVGDLNGDGLDEIAVGSPFTSETVGRGIVYVLSAPGPAELRDGLLDDVAAWILTGDAEQALLGRALTSGDWDGDGTTDLAVSAPSGDSAATSRVFLLDSAALESGQPGGWHTLRYSGSSGDGFGISLESGDGDGDGRPELIIGAPHREDELSGGAVYRFDPAGAGSGSTDIDSSGFLLSGGGPGHHLGGAMAVLDVDGDGFDDLFASHSAFDARYFGDSAADIYVAGYYGPSGTPTLSLTGQNTPWFGAWLSVIGDVTGDGRADLGIGDGGSARFWIWSGRGE